MAAWAKVGVYLPTNAAAQRNSFKRVTDLQLGDLVFYYNDLHHVAIYVGGNKVMHAPTFGDNVRIDCSRTLDGAQLRTSGLTVRGRVSGCVAAAWEDWFDQTRRMSRTEMMPSTSSRPARPGGGNPPRTMAAAASARVQSGPA